MFTNEWKIKAISRSYHLGVNVAIVEAYVQTHLCNDISLYVWIYAQMVKDLANVKVAQVDCQANKQLCQQENVRSYPTIRLYPHGRSDAQIFQ